MPSLLSTRETCRFYRFDPYSLKKISFLHSVIVESRELDQPAHMRELVDASVIPSVFTLYASIIPCVLQYLSLFSGFKPKQYEDNKRKKQEMPQLRDECRLSNLSSIRPI